MNPRITPLRGLERLLCFWRRVTSAIFDPSRADEAFIVGGSFCFAHVLVPYEMRKKRSLDIAMKTGVLLSKVFRKNLMHDSDPAFSRVGDFIGRYLSGLVKKVFFLESPYGQEAQFRVSYWRTELRKAARLLSP